MTSLNDDYRDLLREFLDHRVEFVVVGAYALAVAGAPRATADIDIFVRATAENAERVVAALSRFGAPLATAGVTARDFAVEGTVYQIGVVPRRIDILTAIAGVSFAEAAAGETHAIVDGLDLPFLGRDQLIQNKRAAGRPKDLADVDALVRLADEGGPRRA